MHNNPFQFRHKSRKSMFKSDEEAHAHLEKLKQKSLEHKKAMEANPNDKLAALEYKTNLGHIQATSAHIALYHKKS